MTTSSQSESPAIAENTAPATPSTAASPSRRDLWKAAIKLPMYTVAVIPIWVGSAMAAYETGQLNRLHLGLFLVGAIAIIAWLNLTNDVFDSDTGIDVNKAHSIVNLTGKRNLIFWIANAFLLVGVGAIATISWLQQDLTVLGIILVTCFMGYTYQGPPFRFGYLGLGEPICFVTFGPLALSAAYYSQTGSLDTFALGNPNWLASIFIGITTSLILLCSHFHQVDDDLAAGKQSPVARMGTLRSAYGVTAGCGVAFGVIGLGVALGTLPIAALLCLLSLPWVFQLCRHVLTYHDQPAVVKTSKFIAVTLHFWSGLFLGAGCILARLG